MSYSLFVLLLLMSIWDYCKYCYIECFYAHLFWGVNVCIYPGYFLALKLLNYKVGKYLVDMIKQFSEVSPLT